MPIQKKFILTTAGVVLANAALCAVFAYLVFYQIFPLSNKFFEMEKEIRTTEQELRAYRGQILPEYEDAQKDITKIENLFFIANDDKKELELVLFIDEIIKRNNLGQVSITPPGALEAGKVGVSLTVNGSYTNVIRMLRELENERFFITINQLSILANSTQITMSIAAL